ncbi:MAG: rubredoxin [Pseudomonadota bacterium]
MSTRLNAALGERAWVCVVCGFIYQEKEGIPEDGIAPGTPWEEVDDDWMCPKCGVTKSDFVLLTL